MQSADEWIRVSRSEPCPICGKPDYCTRSKGVAKCMRVESEKPASGEAGGWIHKLEGQQVQTATLKKKREVPQRDWSTFAQQCFESGAKVRASLSTELGVSVEALERLLVGSGFDDYRSLGFSTWPERRQGGMVVGIVRRYRVGVSEGGGNKLTVPGSKHGLYLPRNWWQSPGPVVLCEGGSDTAALLTMGMCAIGRPSNVAGVNLLIGVLREFERPIIVLGERDQKLERVGTTKSCPANCDGCAWCFPGRFGARATAERLAKSLSGKRIMWRMPPAGAKDVREWVRGETAPTAGRFLWRLSKQ